MYSLIVECDYITLHYSVYNYIYNYIILAYNYIILVIVIVCTVTLYNTLSVKIYHVIANNETFLVLGVRFLLIFFPSALLPIRGDGTPGNNGLLTG